MRREAEGLAKERGERPTTAHVLCALASREGLPAELLGERRISRDTLVKALRVVVEDEAPEAAVDRLFARARDVAERTRRASPTSSDPEGAHVLLAICLERTCAAQRALNQLGVDVGRLRAVLTQHLTGAIEPRRAPRQLEAPERASGTQPAARTTTLRPLPSRPVPAAKTPVAPEAPKTEAPIARTESEAITAAPIATIDESPEPPLVRPIAKAPRNLRRSKETARRPPAEPTRFDLDPRLAPTLAAIGTNLTAAAARGELDPVVGRDAEIDRALDVLAKRNANNPCLVGAPGVGKTSIAHGVARRIAAAGGDVLGLDDRVVIEIPIGELLAGTGVRGALAERLGSIRKEVAAARGRVVVFLDEIHALLGGDAGDEAANELKTALSRGELPCIGATTLPEYRRTIERDAALARRFTLVDVPELEESAAKVVVEAASKVLESHHGVSYEAGAKEGAVSWTVRYVPSRALPDKALAALDLANTHTHHNNHPNITRKSLAEV
ncbi:MAG: AAA family ATPase, partial [Polyangiales bacterium]